MEAVNDSDLALQLTWMVESLRRAEARALANKAALEVLHEVRNPLEALINLNYLAFQQANDPSRVREYLKQSKEQLDVLAQVCSETLGLASHSSVRKHVCLVSLIETALRIHRKAMDAKKIHLKKELPDRVIALVHSGNILQVFSNLIGNALDALPYEGTIRVRLRRRFGDVQLVISDNGHGIPKDHLAEVFEPFFTTKGERGNGLGLSLSRNLIERHAGTIRLRSSVVSGRSGTTFKVCIPA